MSRSRDIADLGGVTTRLDQVGNSDGALSNRNMVTNGNFMVSQRGDYTSSSNPSDGDFTVDRWQVVQDGSPSTALIQNTDGSMKLTAGAATTGSMRLRQKFEYSLFPRQYDNKTFILSAKIKSNSQNARLNVYAGGYLAVSGVTSHSGSGQYETLTAIFTTPATITTEFSVHIGIDGVNSANTAISNGDYFEVKEVQLELGDTSTDFEHISVGDQLQKCQRFYYQKDYTINTYEPVKFPCWFGSTQSLTGEWVHPVTMRVPPTFSHNGVGNFRLNDNRGNDQVCDSITRTGGNVNETWLTFGGVNTSFTIGYCGYLNTQVANDAQITFDAEL